MKTNFKEEDLVFVAYSGEVTGEDKIEIEVCTMFNDYPVFLMRGFNMKNKNKAKSRSWQMKEKEGYYGYNICGPR